MSDLWLTPDGFRHYKLVKPYHVRLSGFDIKIPKDFRTDLASVPRVFWNVIPPFGRYTRAAVVHDYLCIYDKITGSRAVTDKLFYDHMIELGVYKWKAKLMFYAVRAAYIIKSRRSTK